MLICERAKVGCKHYAKRDLAVPHDTTGKEVSPRFLVHALGWVEFRKIALQRQWYYLMDSPDADACESPADKQFALVL
jgi:hypothetical protein